MNSKKCYLYLSFDIDFNNALKECLLCNKVVVSRKHAFPVMSHIGVNSK